MGTVKGYTSSVNGENGNFTVTNTHTPSTTTVSGTKTWKDNNDQDGKRPDSIKVNLLANGKVVQSKTVKASDNWKYSFTNLPEFENGKKISYTITEDQVKDYSTTVDGYNLTNSYTPSTPNVPTNKTPNKSSRHNNPIKKIVQKIVQRILPQTGSSSETYLIAIGGVLLILLLSVILLKRKKK